MAEVGGRVIQEPEIRQCSNINEPAAASSILASAKGKSNIALGNPEIEQGFLLTVKATFGGDTAKFHFHSNSRIEELHKELEKQFKLEVAGFKINYKDETEDGDTEWIIMSCNEDLLFCINAIKEKKKNTMILSVSQLLCDLSDNKEGIPCYLLARDICGEIVTAAAGMVLRRPHSVVSQPMTENVKICHPVLHPKAAIPIYTQHYHTIESAVGVSLNWPEDLIDYKYRKPEQEFVHHVRDPSIRVQFSDFIQEMRRIPNGHDMFMLPVDETVFGSKSTKLILDIVESSKWLSTIDNIHAKKWIIGFQIDLWASFLHSQLSKEDRGRIHIINTNSSFSNYKTKDQEKINQAENNLVNGLVEIMIENKARLYVMPICSDSHWMMIFIVPEESIVYCIDSLQVGITPHQRKFVHDLLMRVGASYDAHVHHIHAGALEVKNWRVVNIIHKVQPGTWECGYYTMLYMEKIMLLHTGIDVHKVFPEDHNAYPMAVIEGLIDTFCRHIMQKIAPLCRNFAPFQQRPFQHN